MGPADTPPYIVWDCGPPRKQGCPREWGMLRRTADPDVRHCGACGRDVHCCRSPAEFVRHGELGHCVAIPGRLDAPMARLGTPDPQEILRMKEDADFATDWWRRIVAEPGRLDSAMLELVSRCRDDAQELGGGWRSDPAFLAVLRQAVRDGGVRCLTCGLDHAGDEMGIMLLLQLPFCVVCKTPLALDLLPGSTQLPEQSEDAPLPPDGDPPSAAPGSELGS